MRSNQQNELTGRPLGPVRGIRPPWLDGWLVALGAGLLATTVAMVFFQLSGDLLQPRPINEQMDQVKREPLRDDGAGGRHIWVDTRVRLHSTEADSWLLVVEDGPDHDAFNNGAANGVGPPPRSDELRVYDVRNGRLELKLHFQPQGIGKNAAGWEKLGGGAPVAMDFANDGSNQVIAGYAIPAQAEALVPFAIQWQDDRYQLLSLTPNKPTLSTQGLDFDTNDFRRKAYQEPRSFENAVRDPHFSGVGLTGYRVQTFAFVEKPSPRLLSGYFSAYPDRKPQLLELHASQFRTGSLKLMPCTPSYPACQAPQREQDAIVPPDRMLDRVLVEAWDAVGSRWASPVGVRVIERNR